LSIKPAKLQLIFIPLLKDITGCFFVELNQFLQRLFLGRKRFRQQFLFNNLLQVLISRKNDFEHFGQKLVSFGNDYFSELWQARLVEVDEHLDPFNDLIF
jgi:hypothetical protein